MPRCDLVRSLFMTILGLASAGCRGAPSSSATPAAVAGPAIFSEEAASRGLDFVHANGMDGQYLFVEMMGAGVALLDHDRDGDLDVFLPQGHALGAGARLPFRPGGRLYRNELDPARPELGPRFTDQTEAGGIRATGYGMGVATGDVDGDGWTDLFLANFGPDQLWRNLGDGTYEDLSLPEGPNDPRWSTGAAFLDYDLDGRQDLVVVNYNAYSLATDHACHDDDSGRRDYCGPHAYPADPSSLWRNLGGGRFEDVSARTGFDSRFGPALGVAVADVDDDGWPDILVANDGAPNLLWMNRRGERFVEEGLERGVGVNRNGVAQGNMGVAFGDLDGDCDEDVFITHFRAESNTLWLNDGTGHFEDGTPASGLGPPSLPFTGFGTADLDYDNDGVADLFVTNGEVNIIAAQLEAGAELPLAQTDLLFRGLGGGRFQDVTARAGPAFATPAVGRGAAMGDLDNDGDTDLVATYNHGPARLLINAVGQDRPWLGLELLDEAGLTVAGAQAELEGLRPRRCRRSRTASSYASASDPRVRFGLGEGHAGDATALVTWPDRMRERFEGLAPGRYHRLLRGQGTAVAEATP